MASPICGYRTPGTGNRDCTDQRWKPGATYCATHEQVYRDAKRAAKGARPGVARVLQQAPAFTQISAMSVPDAPVQEGRTHDYIINAELGALLNAAVVGAGKRPAGAFLWIGPSGSGKTDGAEAWAAQAGLEFTKTDAASMTDPEAWFGTREIVVQEGVAVTDYRPSGFVESIQKPGITFIDEISRCRAEGINVLIPLLDHTRQVTNPLTGEVIHRHPQNFIVMAGNVGVNFVGTNAIDPAFWTRATKVVFDYLPEEQEKSVVMQAAGCDIDTAYCLVRFAQETRSKAKSDDEYTGISTRELIRTAQWVADGLPKDLAVKMEILNGVSDEGGTASMRSEFNNLWNGVRTAKDPSNVAPPKAQATPPSTNPSIRGWVCPDHNTVKVIPAGTSAKTGKPYASFKACGTFGCDRTEDNTADAPVPKITPHKPGQVTCKSCGTLQAPGRTTICSACGDTL